MVSSIKFLRLHITDSLTWSENTTSLVRRAQKHLYFLRSMRRVYLPPPILTTYRIAIESILTSCISVWSGGCSVSDSKNVKSGDHQVVSFPYSGPASARCISLVHNIISDLSSRTVFPIGLWSKNYEYSVWDHQVL